MDPEIVENPAPAVPEGNAGIDAGTQGKQEAAPESEQPEQDKPEEKPLTEEQIRLRELERQLKKERNRIGKLVSQRERFRLELEQMRTPSQRQSIADTNEGGEADSEMLTLRRADLERLVAEKAPEVVRQREQQEKLRQAAASARTTLGEERFTELTNELAEVFDGKKQLAVLKTDLPADVLSYLTDPDNSEETEKLADLDDFDFGRALTRIEAKVQANKAKKSEETKPKASKAPEPIEPIKGRGSVDPMPDPANTKAYIAWANRQERKGRS